MKTKFLVLPFCAALAFTSCQKEKSVPLSGNSSTNTGNGQLAANRTPLLGFTEMYAYMPTLNAPYSESRISNAEGSVNEITRTYDISSESSIYISMGDFVNDAAGLDAVMSGNGIMMYSNDDPSIPLADAGIRVGLYSAVSSSWEDYNMMVTEASGDGVIAAAKGVGAWAPNGFSDYLTAEGAANWSVSDVSSFSAYADANNPSVSGWVIYDGLAKHSTMILAVPDATGDRMAYIIEESGSSNLDKVQSIASTIPFASISDL